MKKIIPLLSLCLLGCASAQTTPFTNIYVANNAQIATSVTLPNGSTLTTASGSLGGGTLAGGQWFFGSNVYPATDNSATLGFSSARFQSLYLSSGAHLGGDGTTSHAGVAIGPNGSSPNQGASITPEGTGTNIITKGGLALSGPLTVNPASSTSVNSSFIQNDGSNGALWSFVTSTTLQLGAGSISLNTTGSTTPTTIQKTDGQELDISTAGGGGALQITSGAGQMLLSASGAKLIIAGSGNSSSGGVQTSGGLEPLSGTYNSTAFVGNATKPYAEIHGSHLSGSTVYGSPSASPLGNAGSGATCSVTGNDTSGYIVLTTGTGTAGGNQGTITFAHSYTAAPFVTITDGNAAASATTSRTFVVAGIGPSATGFTFTNSNALSTSTSYVFSYIVIGSQ